MERYDLIVNELQSRVDSGEITLEFAETINDLAYDKYVIESKEEITDSVLEEFKKRVDKLNKENEDANNKVEELIKTWEYKKAISSLTKINESASKIINSLKMNYKSNSAISKLSESLKKILSENNSKIKDLKNKDTKKQLNRFNNAYWIDYTKKHNEAFRETEKELLGYNTKRGMKHDMDKYFMYHVLPAPIAHALHVQFSKHHKNHAKTEEDYTQMMIDWECNRKTKPDKQMKPYEVMDKFYPELKDTMIPILKKYGLPTNAAEDKEMEKKKNEKK